MGIALFTAACAIEIAFALLCVQRKSNLVKASGYLSLVELVAFVLLVWLGVIEWGPRYYVFAALLIVAAASRFPSVFSEAQHQKPLKIGRLIGKTSRNAALFFATAFPAMLFPQYQSIPPTGPLLVGTAIYSYTDPARVDLYSKTIKKEPSSKDLNSHLKIIKTLANTK